MYYNYRKTFKLSHKQMMEEPLDVIMVFDRISQYIAERERNDLQVNT